MPRKLLTTQSRRKYNKIDTRDKLKRTKGFTYFDRAKKEVVVPNWGRNTKLKTLQSKPLSVKTVGRKRRVMALLSKREKVEKIAIENQKKLDYEKRIMEFKFRIPVPCSDADCRKILSFVDNPKILPELCSPDLKGLHPAVQYYVFYLRLATIPEDSTLGLKRFGGQEDTTSTIGQAENWSLPETNHEPEPFSKPWYDYQRRSYQEKPNSDFCFNGMEPSLKNLRRYLPWFVTGEWVKDSLGYLPRLTETIAHVRAREAAYLLTMDTNDQNLTLILPVGQDEKLPPLYPPEWDEL